MARTLARRVASCRERALTAADVANMVGFNFRKGFGGFEIKKLGCAKSKDFSLLLGDIFFSLR